MNTRTVDLSNWSFSFERCLSQLKGTPLYVPPEVIDLGTAIDLLRHLADDDSRDTSFQCQIQERLKSDPVATKWHKLRTTIRNTTHFKVYRSSPDYERYHQAARAVASGTGSDAHKELVCGLDAEIAASRITAPVGQILFHGRGDQSLHASANYASFVSTSLDPTVCIYHAMKRAHQMVPTAKAVIYALTLRDELPALWGNGGNLEEWELLLQSGLSFAMTSSHSGERFDIIEATVGR